MPSRPAELILRTAEPSDAAAITRVYGKAVMNGTATFELVPPDEAEMARRMAELRTAGFPYLVAELDGGLAGYAYAGPYRARPAYRWTVEDSVYIDDTHQGRGIGRALLSAIIDESEAAGFRQMVAVITAAASAGSVALHRALGFAEIGTLGAVGWKHGQWLGTVLMQRPLGEADQTPPREC